MAKRRMFSLDVVNTDAFLDMPASTQALYFSLGMRADDDGFVSSPKRITALCGCKKSDLELLVQKGYIVRFDSGVCAVRDWRINNYIQSDRYTPTLYTEEKLSLEQGGDIPCTAGEAECTHRVSGEGSQSVSDMDTQVRLGKDRSGENRSGKDRSGEGKSDKNNSAEVNKAEVGQRADMGFTVPCTAAAPETVTTAEKRKYGEFGNVMLTGDELERLKQLYPDYRIRINRLSLHMTSTGQRYPSHFDAIKNWDMPGIEPSPPTPGQRIGCGGYDSGRAQ